MPELPEIYNLAQQMNTELPGKIITSVEVRQEKCLNLPVDVFRALVTGKTVGSVTSRGKWIFAELKPGAWFLLSLGMGGNVFLHMPNSQLPEKYQLRIDFKDQACLTIYFSWFGYAHAAADAELKMHKMTAALGMNALDDAEFTYAKFTALLAGRKGGIKSFLMDQKHIAGIGNVYIQDILFKAKLHPDRKIHQLSADEKKLLYTVIRENLRHAVKLGGLIHEHDLYGNKGRFKDFLVGYKAGQPCPECGSVIQEIRTGSTRSYICGKCQK